LILLLLLRVGSFLISLFLRSWKNKVGSPRAQIAVFTAAEESMLALEKAAVAAAAKWEYLVGMRRLLVEMGKAAVGTDRKEDREKEKMKQGDSQDN
jgi:hypothetical protein